MWEARRCQWAAAENTQSFREHWRVYRGLVPADSAFSDLKSRESFLSLKSLLHPCVQRSKTIRHRKQRDRTAITPNYSHLQLQMQEWRRNNKKKILQIQIWDLAKFVHEVKKLNGTQQRIIGFIWCGLTKVGFVVMYLALMPCQNVTWCQSLSIATLLTGSNPCSFRENHFPWSVLPSANWLCISGMHPLPHPYCAILQVHAGKTVLYLYFTPSFLQNHINTFLLSHCYRFILYISTCFHDRNPNTRSSGKSSRASMEITMCTSTPPSCPTTISGSSLEKTCVSVGVLHSVVKAHLHCVMHMSLSDSIKRQ